LARWRDSDYNPLDVLPYTDSSPSKNGANDLIPEFKDIAYPLLTTFVIYAVVRRRSRPAKGGPDPAVQALVAPAWPTD